jgi:hypothetical protein
VTDLATLYPSSTSPGTSPPELTTTIVDSATTTTLTTADNHRYLLKTNTASIGIAIHDNPIADSKLEFIDFDATLPETPTGFGKNKIVITFPTSNKLRGLSTIELTTEGSYLCIQFKDGRWVIYNSNAYYDSNLATSITRATAQDVIDETGSGYVTPEDLKTWSLEKKVVTESVSVSNIVHIASNDEYLDTDRFPADPEYGKSLTYAQFTLVNESRNPANRLQVSNPNQPYFRALKTLADAAFWCDDNLSTNSAATLVMKPGLYSINAIFNNAIRINGANNSNAIGNLDPTQSVIFYQELRPTIAPDDTLAWFDLTGTLRINKSVTTSTISRCYFIGYQKYWEAQSANIDAKFDELVNVTAYYSNYTPIIAPTNFLSFIDTDVNLKENIFLPQCPATNPIAENAGGNFQGGYIYVKNSRLNLSGNSLKGNEIWKVPRVINGIPSNITDGNGFYLNGNYYEAFGHCLGFLILDDDVTLSFGNRSEQLSDNSFLSNRDYNNFRIERNGTLLYGTTDSNYLGQTVSCDRDYRGSDNLGIAGSSTNLSDIDNRGAMVRWFITLKDPGSKLFFQDYLLWNVFAIASDEYNRMSGWRGQFGSIPVIASGSISSFDGVKTTGLRLLNKGMSMSLFAGKQYQYQLWSRAGVERPATTAEALNTNVAATLWNDGFYVNTTINGNNVTGFAVINDVVI